MKTIKQALIDEIHYPISNGFVENVMIKRGLADDQVFSYEVSKSSAYIGAVADCLYSLLHAVNYSEAGMSVGTLSTSDKEAILLRVNKMYKTIGEAEVQTKAKPMVYIGG